MTFWMLHFSKDEYFESSEESAPYEQSYHIFLEPPSKGSETPLQIIAIVFIIIDLVSKTIKY